MELTEMMAKPNTDSKKNFILIIYTVQIIWKVVNVQIYVKTYQK